MDIITAGLIFQGFLILLGGIKAYQNIIVSLAEIKTTLKMCPHVNTELTHHKDQGALVHRAPGI
jgi:hypothetical protein